MFKGKNKILKYAGTFISGVILLSSGVKLDGFAQSFTHVHSNACYGNVSKTCTHYFSFGRDYSSAHCNYCGITSPTVIEGYTDRCPTGTQSDSFAGYTTTCRNCGNVIDSRECGPLRSHTYTERGLTCKMKEGDTSATVSVSANTSGWTNSGVEISCSVSINDSKFSVTGISYSNGGSGSSTTVTENGTYTVTVSGSNGQTITESVTVSNIDKTAPVVSLSKNTDAWTEEGITISASASDDLSGIMGYSFNGGEFSGNSSWHVMSNGSYSVTVRDNAGNESSASISISNIGKDPKIEEEKRRQEEEERKRKEEEERKRKEEEKKKQDNTGGGQSGQNSNGDKGDDKKPTADNKGTPTGTDPKTPQKDNGGKKPASDVKAGEKDDVSQNDLLDVSGNGLTDDASGNDVSGNMINVNKPSDPTGGGKKNPLDTVKKTDADAMNLEASVKKSSFLSIFTDNPVLTFSVGFISLLLAGLIFLSFSYIYELKNGKIRPVSLARIKSDDKKMFISVPSEKLEKNKKYRIFYSLRGRLLKNKHSVVIDVDGTNASSVGADGASFVYNG